MLMSIVFRPITLEEANEVYRWSYKGEYAIYSFSGEEDELAELMDGTFFAANDSEGRLLGYICHGQTAQVPGGFTKGIYDEQGYVDIGLGLRPELTGKGLGLSFIMQGLHYFAELLHADRFRLVVTTFNERAIKVYERAGFMRDVCFPSKVNGTEVMFVSMKHRRKTGG